ncbi:Uncharacterised protein [Bordetella pertussis]|nr:Uncharacterised protein [Bordetella pertussis]
MTYTVFTPGLNSATLNGPDPVMSVMGWPMGMSAMRLGIMKAAVPVGLDSARKARSVGSFMTMRKVWSSTASILSVNFISVRPMPSPPAQRLIDATQSSAVTGLPSCHFWPGRSVMV